MPVTPAHAAAAPILRRLTGGRLVLSALVVGSMSPDFEYLVHLRTHRTIGHTGAGLFLLCLPTSLAVLYLWHRWLKKPLAALLPPGGARLAALADQPFPWHRPLMVVESILIGATSHLVWDGFTHAGGFAVHHIALLQHHYSRYPGWQWAQYLSGVVGLGYVALCVWRHMRSGLPVAERPGSALGDRARRLHVGVLFGAALMGAAANALHTGGRPSHMAAAAAVGTMLAGVLAAVPVAASVRLRQARPR